MVSPSRQRKYQTKLGPTPAELEQEKLINLYEMNPGRHPLLCMPTNLPQFHVLDGGIDGPYNEKVLKIPVWIRFGSPNNDFTMVNNRKYDAYKHMVWSIGECEQAIKTLNLYGNKETDFDKSIEYNSLTWKQGQEKARKGFFKGGRYCEQNERYHPALNDPILKHFVKECIQRVLETMHIPHEQKIAAVGLMFAAWFQPKEA